MHKALYLCLFFLFNAYATFASDRFAYISNASPPGHISICKINNSSGQFENCRAALTNPLGTPLDIALATFNETTYAYISNNTHPAVITQCKVEQNGELQACINTDVPSYTGIALYASDDLHLYLAYPTSVQKCALTRDGQIHKQNCKDSGAGDIFLNGPIYMTFQTFNQVDYVYIANGDYRPHASVIQCIVTHQGDFTDCKDSGAGTQLNGAADIDFITLAGANFAYISEPGGALSKCSVDPGLGLLRDCAPTGSDFHSPLGINIHRIENTFYMYVVDGGFRAPLVNAVSRCRIGLYGDLDCIDSGAGHTFASPFGIIAHKSVHL